MRATWAILTVALVVAACADGSGTADAPDPPVPGEQAPTERGGRSFRVASSEADPGGPRPPTAPELSSAGGASGGGARAVVTPTGVVAPVLATHRHGWSVRTPCGAVATVTEGASVGDVHVVLDPGHGGADEPGAVGANGLTEAEVNLAVARLAAAELATSGYRVLLTRDADYRLPLAGRAAIADAVNAAALVSIHHNAGDAVTLGRPGTEVFHQLDNAEGRRLAGLIWEHTVRNLELFDAGWVGRADAGATARVRRAGDDFYGVLRLPETTAVLAELSYLGNPSEAALLADPAVVAVEASAVAEAVRRWFETSEPGGGYVEPTTMIGGGGGGGGDAGCVDPDLVPG